MKSPNQYPHLTNDTLINYYKTVNINTVAGRTSDTSILVIYTGGTIGMDYAPPGGEIPEGTLIPFDFEQIMEKVPELRRFQFELTVLPFQKLLDSSDIKTHHWISIARTIHDFYNDYDAFVVLHGTDTMAYSAAAVSYLLENLSKPVIFTGSQLPIGVPRTDARENFISALEIASSRADGKALVPEVSIFFDNFLFRGNRARKVQSEDFTAFESENYPPLAVAGIHIDYRKQAILPHPEDAFRFYNKLDSNVVILKLFPGIATDYIKHVLAIPRLRGVVLETFGSGNAPSDYYFIEALKTAIENGIIIYNVSQCNGGSVIQGMYDTSRRLLDIGVISGRDITPEAAITKLMFLIANESDPQEIRRKLAEPIRGEMS